MSPRQVVVAHPEAMVAEGIAAALARYPGIVPVGVATSAEEGERCSAHASAVVLHEDLPGAERLAGQLRRRGVRVVILGDGDGDPDELRIPTCAPVATLAAALDPTAARPPGTLTEREQEVLSLVAGGLAGKRVARHLGISPKTVEQHKTRIFAKLGVPNQTAAVSFALACGLGRSHLWTRSST